MRALAGGRGSSEPAGWSALIYLFPCLDTIAGVALNFFPLATDQFTITLYRFPFIEGERPRSGDEEAVRRRFEVDGNYDLYWTLFQRTEGSTEVVCKPFDNVYVTIDALRLALVRCCRKNLDPDRFQVIEGFRRRVEIITRTYPEGLQVVSLEPYLLRSQSQFGFLAGFRFHPNEEHRGTQRSLQLSLSLDKHGQPNLNYYADRYSHLVAYVANFHGQIFPLDMPDGQKVVVGSQLVELKPETLEVKNYVVGSRVESRSQFMGVKQYGPLKQVPQETHLYFLYRREDHTLSQDLFRALRGDTFRTFPGMKDMFHLPISKENVSGTVLSDFSASEIQHVCDRVLADAAGGNVVPIVLTPFSRHDVPDNNAAYWRLKHAFLSKRLPIQVVATETIADRNKLKWSTAGIGLQVFAKAGGTPWKVRPRTERCLIVGIGQAHRKVEERIERFFAYSVLSDSSGVFEEVRVLGEAHDEENYIENFGTNLRRIFEDYSPRFSSFVVHATFAIRRRELESIASALSERKERAKTGEFVSLKFSDRNRFFGFAVDHNSRVPYESSVVSLSRNEFLVWFEGRQYGQTALHKMVGKPLHVQFTYPDEKLSRPQQRAHLQDAINLSGANWRGFNAKSLPVSVYYAQLIAKYLKEFENHRLPSVDVNIIKPWFL